MAYQGGGVWRTQSNNSKMVSPPEFYFRNGTLTLPAVNVTGQGNLGDSATVSHGETIGNASKFPNGEMDQSEFTNPLTNHRVKLVVQSEYYKGWGSYFEERTDGEVTYNHDRDIVNFTLVSPIGKQEANAAIASLSTSGSFSVSGTAADPCSSGAGGPPSDRPYADSYNSSGTDDNFCELKASGNLGNDGNITYGGDIDLSRGSGGADIIGSLKSGGKVTLSGSGGGGPGGGPGGGGGQPAVTGDVFHFDGCVVSGGGGGSCSGTVGGIVDTLDGNLKPSRPVNSYIDTTVDDIRSDNDNAGSDITGNRLVFDDSGESDTVTLTAGRYYLDEIDFSGAGSGGTRLNLDTSGGPITLAVEEHVDVSGATINVSGDRTARVYVAGEDTDSSGNHFRISSGDVEVQHDDAPELRMYADDDFTTTISDGSFTGVIYAPPGSSGTGSLTISQGALFGGAIIGDTTLNTQASVHFDEALRDEQIISPSAKVEKITYLHVSINRIQVESN
jgi:hypothetical protein